MSYHYQEITKPTMSEPFIWSNDFIIYRPATTQHRNDDLTLPFLMFPAGVQPRLIQGIRSWDGVGEGQDTVASIRY